MKAIVQDRYGAPSDVLELREVEVPSIEHDQVLIRVRASSVNPYDWHFMRGIPYIMRPVSGLRRPRKTILGADVAGVVEAVGPGVTRFGVGDEVYAEVDGGGFAEYAAVAERLVARAPANLPLEQAAAVPLAGITALQGLRDHGRMEPGQRVLIIGASGGVGTFAVQIACAWGADVTGVCSGSNAELVRSLGAERVVDYTRQDYLREGGAHDLVFQLGGTRSAADCRPALTKDGTLLMASGDASGRVLGPVGRILVAKVRDPFVSQRLVSFTAAAGGQDLDVLRDLIEAGEVTPVVETTHPLPEVPRAMRHIETGHTRGKVVITT